MRKYQHTLLELDDYVYHSKQEVYPHCTLWGDFNLALDGCLEILVEQQTYLIPPGYCLWIPPRYVHQAVSKEGQTSHFVCLRIAPELSGALANSPKMIHVSPFVQVLIQRLLMHKSKQHTETQQWHLLLVLFDELQAAPFFEHYLPFTQDSVLKPILEFLLEAKHHTLKLSQVCESFSLSERHLLRLAQQQLSMPISEWRRRAKLLYAMQALKTGQSAKSISLELGYQHASAFIEFFKRYTQMTPEQFRHRQRLRQGTNKNSA